MTRLTLAQGVEVPASDIVGATHVYYGGLALPLAGLAADANFDVFMKDCQLFAHPWLDDTTQDAPIEGEFLGSLRTTLAGVTEDSRKKRFLSNAKNRVMRPMRVIDPAANWAYSAVAWRQANGNVANRLDFLACMSGLRVKAHHASAVTNSTTTPRTVHFGIGLDRTDENDASANYPYSCTSNAWGAGEAFFDDYAPIGFHYLARLEHGGGTDTQTWHGTPANGKFLSGIWGEIEA